MSTVRRALDTVDVRSGEPAKAINQRSDVTAVPAAGVVAEAMAALVLADAAIEKFGGDSVAEARRNAVLNLLSMNNIPVTPDRVVIGPSIATGLSGVEAVEINLRIG